MTPLQGAGARQAIEVSSECCILPSCIHVAVGRICARAAPAQCIYNTHKCSARTQHLLAGTHARRQDRGRYVAREQLLVSFSYAGRSRNFSPRVGRAHACWEMAHGRNDPLEDVRRALETLEKGVDA